jgi:hypothetical protein
MEKIWGRSLLRQFWGDLFLLARLRQNLNGSSTASESSPNLGLDGYRTNLLVSRFQLLHPVPLVYAGDSISSNPLPGVS